MRTVTDSGMRPKDSANQSAASTESEMRQLSPLLPDTNKLHCLPKIDEFISVSEELVHFHL